MKIAFYKGLNRLPYPKPLDLAISMTTMNSYTHVELVFPDGMWFTSSPRDGGVRFKRIIPKPYTWDVYGLGVSNRCVDIMRAHAEKLASGPVIKYDVIGALFSGFDLCFPNDKMFCSEAVDEVMSSCIPGLPKPCKTNPGSLYRHLAKTGLILPIYRISN